ncbi:beta galactosidase jelly roll domain-containing protein [Pelagicoccus mobilis]|uniref:Beta galactosidase jelly roll domain-containing protein n=1 Tax=Pelagicoccus mobilis TaxID=415221 RepID=A0A934S158_9BACT|nr:beta galactosidase jelly roll domain-containing protein [Pelagicoccus mobilis]MBK1878686.1 beta galactosidase jelly roll domain-containing protein [Pelagicoccus mobilis]
MFESQENRSEESSSKKENSSTAIIAGIVTLASSTGLLSWFGIFGDEHSNRGQAGLVVPATHQFITKDTRERVVGLKGEWKFNLGDDASWAASEFDDSGWEQISVPGDWNEQGYESYDGFAWYRKAFRIEAKDTYRPLFLFLGRVDDVDEVFVNGTRIDGRGKMHPEYLTAWNQNRIYRVPPLLLKADEENVIAVRVFDDQLSGGIVQGPVGIYASELPQPLLDLAGLWQFRTGDDSRWASEMGEGFTEVQVPLVWEANGFEDYDGYAWYQKRFGAVTVGDEERLALVLGKIDDTDEVFLNGERIGQTGKLDGKDRERNSEFWRRNRVYEFPTHLLREENLLAVRVHDSAGAGGIYSGPVGIMRVEDVVKGETLAEEARGMTWPEVWNWLLGRDED